MERPVQLTLDQDFSLRIFADQVKRMSPEQAQAFLIEQHKLMMVQETIFRKLLNGEG